VRAIVHTKYGPPEVVHLKEIDRPIPKEKEILLKVYASTVNRTDCGFRSANYFVSRFFSGLFRPKYKTLGCEFAGIVEEIGSKVTKFKQGDEIFGFNDQRFGGHAEYMTISEDGAITLKPKNITFDLAAALTEGAHYALVDIRAAKVKTGDKVLVNGATGGIGSAAVQILKHFGADVTAVANTKNIDLVKSLGADRVIDYQKEDFTKIDEKFSFIFDAVGKSSFGKCKPLLTKKGIYISTELGKGGQNIFLALFTPLFRGRKLRFPIPLAKKEDIVFLGELAESGAFKPVIDRVYSLDEIVEAYRYAETGEKTGNLILKIVD
jgi:NADPH:quinone reductase-like Zn-dependent oxidoreductase